jgi:hypothetical protein
MKRNILLLLMIVSYIISGCKKTSTLLPEGKTSIVKDSVAKNSFAKNSFTNDTISDYSNRILVDASKDGGTWWFPQSSLIGFSPKEDHQGANLVLYLVSLGYAVDELPRDTVPVTSSLLSKYSKIIRATGFGAYTNEELQAYDDFLNKGGSLLLIADFLYGAQTDGLAQHLGLQITGVFSGNVSVFTPDSITDGANPLPYIAGSIVTNASNNPNITVLGSFDNSYYLDLNYNGKPDSGDIIGPPALVKLNNFNGKVIFLGDINGFETVSQPLTKNLFHWLFE